MARSAHARPAVLGAAIAGAAALASLAACVDLFHTTDFPTLCALDAAACGSEAGTPGVDAGADAAPAPIDLCAESSTEARRRAGHACGFLNACLGNVEGTSFASCMRLALGAFDCTYNPSLRPRGETAKLWDCLAKAETCDAVEVCVFGTPAPGCNPDNAGTFTACNRESTVVVECGASTTALGMTPCALEGRGCAKVDSSKAVCAGRGGATCNDAAPARCEDAHAVVCRTSGGISRDEGVDCARYGAGECFLDGDGVACVPVDTAPGCGGRLTVSCKGKIAESCVGNKLVRIDCGAIGLGCDAARATTSSPESACVTTAPTPCAATKDDCSGGKLQSCFNGISFELRCEDVGLGTCFDANDTLPARCGQPK